MPKKDNHIKVERETFVKDDKTYYSYFIKGNVRGKDIKVAIAPPNQDTDKGGYTVLDIVFGNSMTADLIVNPFEMKDTKTGKIISGNSYLVRTVDENGDVYECAVKPFRSSDKALLNMLMR